MGPTVSRLALQIDRYTYQFWNHFVQLLLIITVCPGTRSLDSTLKKERKNESFNDNSTTPVTPTYDVTSRVVNSRNIYFTPNNHKSNTWTKFFEVDWWFWWWIKNETQQIMTEREKLSSSFSIESLLSPSTAKQEDSREKWPRHPQLTKRKAIEKGKKKIKQILLLFFSNYYP